MSKFKIVPTSTGIFVTNTETGCVLVLSRFDADQLQAGLAQALEDLDRGEDEARAAAAEEEDLALEKAGLDDWGHAGSGEAALDTIVQAFNQVNRQVDEACIMCGEPAYYMGMCKKHCW